LVYTVTLLILVLVVRKISSITQSIRPNCIRFIFTYPLQLKLLLCLFLVSSNEPYQIFRIGYWDTCIIITTLSQKWSQAYPIVNSVLRIIEGIAHFLFS